MPAIPIDASNRTTEWQIMEMELWFLHVSLILFVICVICIVRTDPEETRYVTYVPPAHVDEKYAS